MGAHLAAFSQPDRCCVTSKPVHHRSGTHGLSRLNWRGGTSRKGFVRAGGAQLGLLLLLVILTEDRPHGNFPHDHAGITDPPDSRKSFPEAVSEKWRTTPLAWAIGHRHHSRRDGSDKE